jgi:4-amino-4-deoxy-L-arabinose transferase-like glycosyltransferase
LVAGVAYRGRSPRTDGRRAAYLIWGGWLVVTALVFSLMAGIYHAYYTVALAPAVAALVAMGAAEAWERRARRSGRLVLAAATAVTGAWSFALQSRTPTWLPALRIVVLALTMVAVAGWLVAGQVHRRAVPVLAALAVAAGLLGPAAYTAVTIATPHTGSIVSAGPAVSGSPGGLGGPGGPGGPPPGAVAGGIPDGAPNSTRGGALAGGPDGLLQAGTPSTELVGLLSADAQQYTWVAATIGSQTAAGLQLATALPVMPVGGFNGSDPSPTLAQFQEYVAAGRIHYFVAGGGAGPQDGGGFGPQQGGSDAARQIAAWVAATYPASSVGGVTVYDLTSP